MPNKDPATRDYAKEYRDYGGTAEQKKRRAGRNTARRWALRKGLVQKGDNKEVDHRNFDTTDNRPSNLRVMKKGTNRGRKPT